MSDLIYLYGAYTIIWAGVFCYIIKLHLDQRKLKKEIELLRKILNEKRTKKDI